MTGKSPLQEAIDKAGSEAKLGSLTGYSQVAINKAKHRGRASPAMAVKIERETGVPRHLLCPDIFPAPVSPPPSSTEAA